MCLSHEKNKNNVINYAESPDCFPLLLFLPPSSSFVCVWLCVYVISQCACVYSFLFTFLYVNELLCEKDEDKKNVTLKKTKQYWAAFSYLLSPLLGWFLLTGTCLKLEKAAADSLSSKVPFNFSFAPS